ncbi:MAG: hypothetical protein GY750_20830 [Lentisphaerae bacterium]|nr:hypothetical protein [Lentisphaerota bacterium]
MDLFGHIEFEGNEWENHYTGMPEYNNTKELEPEVVVKFKFRNKEDFEKFNELLKQHVFNCNKIFDGMQRKNDYQSWFPHKEKGSDYIYE